MNFSEVYNIRFTEIPSFFPEVLIYVGRRTNLLKLKFKNVKK
jgi:peptide subunit release factor RF-3